jgi:hypothetical protein
MPNSRQLPTRRHFLRRHLTAPADNPFIHLIHNSLKHR